MRIGWNGAVLEAGEAVIPAMDHGLLYGIGLFETFRTYGGAPFALGRRLARLRHGCETLGIRWTMTDAEVRGWLAAVLEANGLADAYVRLTVTAGDAGLGLTDGPYERPNTLLMVKPLPPLGERLYREGRELRILRTPRGTPETRVRLKSLHYMTNVLAKRELAESGASAGAEGMMLTREGWLAEGIVSNLFFVKDGVVRTPAVETGILPGITRALTLELARSMGLETEEGYYTTADLLAADEVWLTGSVQELVPVTRIAEADGTAHTVGDGLAGPVTKALLAAYRAAVERSVRGAAEGV
jgi:4-amino-4-deoxychorismate lyase